MFLPLTNRDWKMTLSGSDRRMEEQCESDGEREQTHSVSETRGGDASAADLVDLIDPVLTLLTLC